MLAKQMCSARNNCLPFSSHFTASFFYLPRQTNPSSNRRRTPQRDMFAEVTLVGCAMTTALFAVPVASRNTLKSELLLPRAIVLCLSRGMLMHEGRKGEEEKTIDLQGAKKCAYINFTCVYGPLCYQGLAWMILKHKIYVVVFLPCRCFCFGERSRAARHT